MFYRLQLVFENWMSQSSTKIKFFIIPLHSYVQLYSRISGNFHNDLIFRFFAISFTMRIIEYTEIIFCIILYKKLSNCTKWLMHIKNAKHFHSFRKFCDTLKKNPNTQYISYNNWGTCSMLEFLTQLHHLLNCCFSNFSQTQKLAPPPDRLSLSVTVDQFDHWFIGGQVFCQAAIQRQDVYIYLFNTLKH